MRALGVAALVVLHATAFAQPAPEGPPPPPPPADGAPPPVLPPPPTPAEQAFLDGRALMDEGKHAEACAKFEESLKLVPDASGTLLNLGLCNMRLGHTATALAWFRRAQFRAAETGMTDDEDVAKTNSFSLSVRVPTIRILVSSARPAGSTVFVDDKQLTDLDLAKLEIDPGTHVVELREAGKPPVRSEVTVKDGDNKDVTLTVVVPPPPKVYVDIDRGRTRRIIAYSLAGAGAALWAGSLAVSLSARDDQDASEHPEDWRHAEQVARFGGTGLFLAGTAAIATGVYLYLSAPGVEHVERTALAPLVGSDQVGLVVRGGF